MGKATSDRVGKLLDKVAREVTEQVRVNRCQDSPRLMAELSAKLLEAKLGPLLRAGQAMRDWQQGEGLDRLWRDVKADYDTALAALEGRDGK